MRVIGIAGGSGSGKSTVSYELQDQRPDDIEVLNFDDYQAVSEPRPLNMPMVDGMINWDHPGAIRWDNIIRDVKTLRANKPITIESWAHRSNPDYFKHRKFIGRTVVPKDILIVEGYLALYSPELRELYDVSFYLDADEDTRRQRRRDAQGGKDTIIGQADDVEKVLRPMHWEYVEPTKANTDHVIDTSKLSIDAICERITLLAEI